MKKSTYKKIFASAIRKKTYKPVNMKDKLLRQELSRVQSSLWKLQNKVQDLIKEIDKEEE